MTGASWAGQGRDAAAPQTLGDVRALWRLVDAFTEVRKREPLPRALVGLAAGVEGVEGVAVIDPGGAGHAPDVAACSSEDVRHLSELQLGDPAGGPALEALRTGVPVLLDGLDGPDGTDGTAPSTRFAEAARELGVGFVHAFPLRRHDRTYASLVVYGRGRGPLRAADLSALRWWVDVAAVGLSLRRSLRNAEERAQQLERALRSRVVIEQAKGVLVAQDAPDLAEAFEVLRARARAGRVRVEDVARAVVAEASSTSEHPVVPRQRPGPEDDA